MPKVLVISVGDDSHLPLVQKHLSEEVWIYDPLKFPDNTDITYAFSNGCMRIISEGRELSSVSSVWFRKPSYLKPKDLQVDPEYVEFTHDSYMHGVRAIYDLMATKYWMSDYRAIMRANNKLYQLGIAHKIGMHVPDTIVTSNPLEASDFRKKHGYVVTKSLEFSTMFIDGMVQAFFATSLAPDEEVDFSGLELAPTIFQEEIRGKLDVRVTVVENRVFACLIRPTGEFSDSTDWRMGILTKDVLYDPIALEPHLEDMCVRLVKALGLTFGVVEFALDKNGTPWFLEINPNGQWAFIEQNTGMEISSAIAEALESH